MNTRDNELDAYCVTSNSLYHEVAQRKAFNRSVETSVRQCEPLAAQQLRSMIARNRQIIDEARVSLGDSSI